jgi:putative FmdB family regulatory protein
MPTYEYECKACKHEFEIFQSMKDDALKKCPECGRNKLVRLIGTGAGIIFKGSGFYETDYRSSNYQSAAAKDKPSSSTAKSSSAKKSAPKSEKKDGN